MPEHYDHNDRSFDINDFRPDYLHDGIDHDLDPVPDIDVLTDDVNITHDDVDYHDGDAVDYRRHNHHDQSYNDECPRCAWLRAQ